MLQKIKRFVLALLVIMALTMALAPTAAAQAVCAQTYTVQAGDWLSIIAQRYLGDAKAYAAIFDATNAAAKADSSYATLTDVNAIEVGQKLCIPAATAVPGRESAGIYTTVGPAADASALVETLVLGGDGQVRYTLDYIGKASVDAKGTWNQTGDTVTVRLNEQAGKATDQTMTFTVKDGNLVTSGDNPTTYAKTSPDNAFYSALYTAGRKSADGTQTLTALTLLPDGRAMMNLTQGDQFITQNGTWTLGTNADTKAPTITVNLTDQGGTPISDKYVMQVDGANLRATEYDSAKWGTDLSFVRFYAPAEPVTPASAEAAAAWAGKYTTAAPAVDAVGQELVLELMTDNTATFTTQFIGKGEPIVDKGTWKQDNGNLAVELDGPGGKQSLVIKPEDGALILQDHGTGGLTLTKVPSGQTHTAEFGGVTFSFDEQLAKSAAGTALPAVPVTEGPALGGGTPAYIRFLFDGKTANDFFDPRLGQVLVYKTDDWTKLDPSTAKAVEDLKKLLQDKPTTFDQGIPLLPLISATQVFRVHPQYFDFQNGKGVGFVTYYAQDVSPVTANMIFYTYQGLTNDGKYYVSVFYPVTTAYLPPDANTGLGGQSYDEWAKNYNTYLADLVKGLDGLLTASYTPDLDLAQGMIKSINVGENTLP